MVIAKRLTSQWQLNRKIQRHFIPSISIKSQVLSDFMDEFSLTILHVVEQELRIRKDDIHVREGKLYTVGTSNVRGEGV